MGEIHKRVEAVDMRSLRIVAVAVAIAAVAAGVGLFVSRRRRGRTLAQRLQDGLPESMRHPAALGAQLRRPLERAVRAL
jgi:hypothetical protein